MSNTNTTSENVQKSINDIYSSLLEKRRSQKAKRKEDKQIEKDMRKEVEEQNESIETPLTKKEKRAAKLESWKEIVVGLTGEDLEYKGNKKNKTKYKKWIDEETGNNIAPIENKKRKKKNFNKEFEPEITMLKAIVADQNKFTTDLQRRYQHAAGPNTRDAMPLNKNLVELAAVINSSRSNSLGMLREIGTLKKNIADLYMKQAKQDAELGGTGYTNTEDLGLLGSSIADSLFNTSPISNTYSQQEPMMQTETSSQTYNNSNIIPIPVQYVEAKPFDPSTWDDDSLDTSSVQYEAIPHQVVVEFDKANSNARFKAIRRDNNEELMGCPVPEVDLSTLTFNEKDKIVKGQFDEVYPLEII